MSTELEELYVALTADVEKFRDELVKAGVVSEEFGDKVEGAGEKTDQFSEKTDEGALSLTDLKSGIDLAFGALEMLQKGYDATIGMTLEMIDQTRMLSNTIGATPEEASKLIAVADDLGISFGKLEAAMSAAVRSGVEPTIENIGKLADEYNAIADPMEQSEFLMKRFGKSAVEIAELMKLGSAGIREMGDAAEDVNQVFSAEDLANAKEFEMAWDNLVDTIKSGAIELTTNVLPFLTQAANGAAAFFSGYILLVEAVWKKEAELIGLSKQVQENYADASGNLPMDEAVAIWQAEQANLNAELLKSENIAGAAAEQYNNYAMMAYEAAQATDSVSEAQLNYQDMLERSARVNEDFEGTLFDSNLTLSETFDLMDMGISNTIAQWKEYIEWMQAGGLDLQLAFEQVKKQLLDGAITPSEADEYFNELFVKAQVLDEDLGKITADDAAKNIADTLGVSLADAYAIYKDMKADIAAGIEGYANIAVNVTYPDEQTGPAPKGGGGGGGGSDNGGGIGGPADQYEEQAEGGDYWVTQPTRYVADEAGTERAIFIPQGKTFADVARGPLEGGRGGDTIYINDQLAASLYLEQKRREKIALMEAGM